VKVKLGDVCEIVSGTTPKSNHLEYWNGDINWITPAELTEDSDVIYESQRKITERAVIESSLRLFPAGTVLLSSRAPIGKVAIAGIEMCCNQGFKNLICSYKIYNRYLFHFLKNKTDYLYSLGRGATFKEISKSIVENIEIDLPLLDEQRHISAVLDKVSDLIALRKKQLAKLDELVKARFVEMFGEWFIYNKNEKNLIDICNFIDYRGKTPEKSSTGIPLITAKNVRDNFFSIEPQEFIPEENYDIIMTRGIPKINDILFTTEAPLGNVCRIPNIYDKFCVGQRIVTMQPFESIVLSEYLEYALLTDEFKEKMWQKSSGSTVKGIRSKLLEHLTIPVPTIELQNQFATFVEVVDKQKNTIKLSLEKFEMLKKSLMQKYFG